MANELKIKNGLIVQGPLTASFAYTTASWSQNAVTASFATTASYVLGTVATASLATSASYALSASNAITASNLLGVNFVSTGSIVASLNTASAVISLITASYLAAFFDYAAVSASNSRCGTVFGSWVNGSVTFAEISNVDVGDTSPVTMSIGLNGNTAQLSASVSTGPWTIRALARFI